MICKALLWTDVFWISYIKWYKFYNNNLLVVLGTANLKPQTRKLIVNSFAGSLIFNFLGYFAEISSYFSMKKNRTKVRKCIRCVKEFPHRFDLANGKYMSIFLRAFVKTVKDAHSAQVIPIFDEFHVKNWKQKILYGFSLQN